MVDNGKYLGVYALFLVLGWIFISFFFYQGVDKIAVSSGITLHHSALKAVLSATLAFYTKTDVGLLTNRFSQGMELIDGELPRAMMNRIFSVFTAIGQVVLIAVAAPPNHRVISLHRSRFLCDTEILSSDIQSLADSGS